jgi:Flp pilus assembly protein TadD
MGSTDQDLIGQARRAVSSGDYARADSLARKVLRDGPDNVDALEIAFLCQQARRELIGAEASLRQIVQLAPQKQWPRGDLARLLLSAGRVTDAEAVLRRPRDQQAAVVGAEIERRIGRDRGAGGICR